MAKAALSLEETRRMFLHVAERMEASKDLLTQADKAIGDGDHGVGMARGFEAVRQLLESQSFATIDDLVRGVGTALLTSVGGASGAIFGTLFRGGARNLGGQQEFHTRTLLRLLTDGLQAVQDRGKAKVGDKTMVDALDPAARTAVEMATLPLDGVLAAVVEAARQGMESTRDMVAMIGKAKTLGERSKGHLDPGAISMHIILQAMHEYVA